MEIYDLGQRQLYGVWRAAKSRCYNPNNRQWKHYGGKGVRMCDEWKDSYAAFHSWSMANGYSRDLSIDRIDSDGNYEPANCRWISRSENSRLSTVVRKGRCGYKLTKEIASQMKSAFLAGGKTQSDLGEMFGINASNVSMILRGLAWPEAEPVGAVMKTRKLLSSMPQDTQARVAILLSIGDTVFKIAKDLDVSKKHVESILRLIPERDFPFESEVAVSQ